MPLIGSDVPFFSKDCMNFTDHSHMRGDQDERTLILYRLVLLFSQTLRTVKVTGRRESTLDEGFLTLRLKYHHRPTFLSSFLPFF